MDNLKSKTKEEQEKELAERAKLLIEHQEKQYNAALSGIVGLENKAIKIFGALNVIITVALLIIRYWWDDIFPEHFSSLNYVCVTVLFAFFVFSFVSWGFIFAAMQLNDRERPSSSEEMVDFYMNRPRYNSLSSYSREYSRLTALLGDIHDEKARLINNCSESMLYSAWAFVVFFIIVFILKLT
ncbi:hypothetical protein [Serratia nevei]|uniref:hypothetical protein n=1 Tax=Serratia nevei TaxID=2703794 RepID=UPI0036CCDDFA